MPPISKEAARVLAKVQAAQAPYWECMRPGVVNVQDFGTNARRLHDDVRGNQRLLGQKFGMLPLYIQRDALFASFENQVLITPNISTKRKIILIIHDP